MTSPPPTTTPPGLPNAGSTLLVRTAFGNERAWSSVVEGATTPSPGDGFLAGVEIVDDQAYRDLAPEDLRALLPAGETITFFFVADGPALADPEHPLLVVPVPQPDLEFLDEPPREAFRVVVTRLWSVENNLSLANLDWDDFAHSTGPDGVFRGF